MSEDVNLYLNNDNEFEFAYNLCMQDFEHSELINMLTIGSICEKQLAALLIENIYNDNDARILLNNLTKCDGKIREAVAFKINCILTSNTSARGIFAKLSAQDFANATIDINANICRMIINSSVLLRDYNDFATCYSSLIFKYANDALLELNKFVFKDKKFIINKQLFKLFWCLDALSYFYDCIDANHVEALLTQCSLIKEYTIREKTAKIVSKSDKFDKLSALLKNDDNYYVREAFISSKHF